MTISFSKRTRVYILLPTLTREPTWLRPLFFKLRDPYGVQVTVPVRWKLSGMWKTLFFAVGKLAEFRRQQLRVFKSKIVYAAGTDLTIGGMGAGVITDCMPIVAFHEEHEEQGEGAGAFHSSNRSSSKSDGGFPLNLLSASLLPKFPASFSDGSLHEFEPWLRQLVKSIRRNRLAEVRFLLESDLLRPPQSSHLAQYDISHNLLPPEENQPNYSLLVDLPTSTRNLELLSLLISRGLCQMNYAALRVLMHNFEDIPKIYGGPRGLLLGYLLRHPNPLSIVSAFLTALRAEIRERQGKRTTAELEGVQGCFTLLGQKIMRKIVANMKGATSDISERLPCVTAVLDPNAPALSREKDGSEHQASTNVATISEMAPLRIAFADRDAEFMSEPMVEEFSQLAWMGEELLLERGQEDNHTLSFLNPDFLYVVVLNLGLSCPANRAMNFTSKFWHLSVFSGQSFFNSPRGRWTMRLLASIMFIIVYLQVTGAALPNWWDISTTDDYYISNERFNNPTLASFQAGGGKITAHARGTIINCALFAVFMAGNILEALQQIIFRYDKNILWYVSTRKLQFFILCIDIFLLYLTTMYALTLSHVVYYDSLIMLKLSMCWTALAPIVWGRILVTFIPLIKKLGPMLQTFQGMLVEILIFAVPWVIITCGFSVSLQVVYQPLGLPGFQSWTDVMFLLFRAFSDKFDWVLLDAIDELGLPSEVAATYRLYGIVIMIIYTILSTILLGNLLIAIITNRYKPELARAQFLLNFAETVDTHRWMVSQNLLSSPFNLIPLVLFWLPAGRRRKVHPNSFFRIGLFALDGFLPATPRHPFLPCGRHEIPHLLFLLTIHPLLMAFTTVLFYLQAPYCTYIFAVSGHKALMQQINDLRSLSMRSRGQGSLVASQVLQANTARSPDAKGRRASTLRLSKLGLPPLANGTGMVEGELNQETIDAEMAAIGGRNILPEDKNDYEPNNPLMVLWTAVRDVVVKVVSFSVFFVMGCVAYNIVVGGLLVIFLPLSIWLAAIAWSLYHIFAGAVHTLLAAITMLVRRLYHVRSLSKVSPDTNCAPAFHTNEDVKKIQLEKRMQEDSLLNPSEIEDCIAESFSPNCLEDMNRGLGGDEIARNWAKQIAQQHALKGNLHDTSLSGSGQNLAAPQSSPSSPDGHGPTSSRSLQERASRLSRTSYK